MLEYAFPLGTALDGADAHGYLALEHLHAAAVGRANEIDNILGEIWALIHHGDENALYLEVGVHFAAHLAVGLEQQFKALCREELWLGRYQHAVRRNEGVDGQNV